MSTERVLLSDEALQALAKKLVSDISYKRNPTPDRIAIIVADEGTRRNLDPFDAIRLAAWVGILYSRGYSNLEV